MEAEFPPITDEARALAGLYELEYEKMWEMHNSRPGITSNPYFELARRTLSPAGFNLWRSWPIDLRVSVLEQWAAIYISEQSK